MTAGLCPEKQLNDLLGALGGSGGLPDAEALLREYPDDPRLVFLRGSLLAAAGDFAGARVAMRRAVDLAPDYHVARFQLGFLHLTSGEPHAAQESWGPLHALPTDNYLRLFVDGLCHLIRDEFSDTIRLLEDGIARNRDNEPMNRDMRLIVEKAREKLVGERDTPVSSVDLLLQQSALKATRH